MKKWAEQFEQVPTSGNLSSQLESKLSSIHLIDDLSVFSYKALQKGWALKVPKRAPRFPDKVRNYLQEKFDIGNTTGHKLILCKILLTLDVQEMSKVDVYLLPASVYRHSKFVHFSQGSQQQRGPTYKTQLI